MSNPRKSNRKSTPAKLPDVFPHLAPDNGVTEQATVQKLFESLTQHFLPQDILEEIWLHDIARITANIEIFRTIERTVQYRAMEERLEYLVKMSSISEAHSKAALKGIYELTIGPNGATKKPDFQTVRIAGGIGEVQLQKIASISDTIQKLQRERDRIYAQFDRKRQPLIIASVKRAEEQENKASPNANVAE